VSNRHKKNFLTDTEESAKSSHNSHKPIDQTNADISWIRRLFLETAS